MNEERRYRIEAICAVDRLLARLFRSPLDRETAAAIAELAADDGPDFLLEDERCAQGLAAMGAWCGTASDDDLHAASADFHRLFVGPDKLLAPPWSSVYADRGSLFSETEQVVEAEFRRHGLINPEGHHEPCDHIAYELQFVADVLGRAVADDGVDAGSAADAAKLEAGDAAAREAAGDGAGVDAEALVGDAAAFLERFVAPWSDAFLDDVRAGSRALFYPALADFTRGAIAVQRELLADER